MAATRKIAPAMGEKYFNVLRRVISTILVRPFKLGANFRAIRSAESPQRLEPLLRHLTNEKLCRRSNSVRH